MTDEPKIYTQQEMDDVLEFKNGVIRGTEDVVLRLGRQRDDARALADQLAIAVHAERDKICRCGRKSDGYQTTARILEAYERRDWR